MRNTIQKTIILFALLIITPLANAAYNNTSDYWKCYNRVGGSWTFGRAPYFCSSSPFISDNLVKSKFGTYIFDDSKNRTRETERYVTEINHLVKEAAQYYLKKRKPSVSSTEIKYWTEAIEALTHQESFMSHYRDGTDNKIRMMRGDYGHGHGLMQIDDRWHFVAANSGKAAHVISNLFYALDIYFEAWQAAPSKYCVSGNTDYYDRIRAAYSAYNGGLDDICRFRNPNHTWSRNDRNFKDKLDKKSWKRYINSNPTEVNIACLSNSTSESCSGTTPQPNPTPNPEPSPAPIEKEIYAVGDFIELQKSINARETPGGTWLGVFNEGESYQVLDTYISNNSTKSRYYLLRSGSLRGYVYAGNQSTHEDWATLGRESHKYLPTKGSTVSVATSGTNLRATAGGRLLATVPGGTRLQVLDTIVKGEDKDLYIKVKYGRHTGYMYSGLIAPRYTVPYWITISQN